jgi:hypothetical protein
MDIEDAQREVRSVYIGGFCGQLVSSVIWLASAAVGTWVSPKASILTIVIAGFFIFPLTQMLLRLSGRPASVSSENSFHTLGMQVALVLPFSMLLLVPVGYFRLNWSFPALMVLLGAHYLPFAFLYGMRIFLFLAGFLIAMGVVIAQHFSQTFSHKNVTPIVEVLWNEWKTIRLVFASESSKIHLRRRRLNQE